MPFNYSDFYEPGKKVGYTVIKDVKRGIIGMRPTFDTILSHNQNESLPYSVEFRQFFT